MNGIQIIATNKRGDSVSFADPLRLVRVDGLSGLNANNYYSESTKDGSTRTGTSLANRNIEIEFKLMKKAGFSAATVEDYRTKLFRVLNPKLNPIRIDVITNAGKRYYVNANVDATPSFSGDNLAHVSGLIQFSCDNPFIYEADEERVDIASWADNFSFPLELTETGIEMGYRNPSLIVNVLNEGQTETGMRIRFRALGTVVNPSLISINTGEYIRLNITLSSGDVLEVSTFSGNKYIELTQNGTTSNKFNVLDLSSDFLQLDVGDNLFRYDAEEFIDNLEVDIRFRNTLLGV